MLLHESRSILAQDAVLSIAVPGKPGDMLAFTKHTVPRINEAVDFVNVMTYDLINRRNTATTYHTGIVGSREGIQAYLDRGFQGERLNLGFAFYVKWFNTDPSQHQGGPTGIRTVLLEDPDTGADLGQAGAIVWSGLTAEMQEGLDRAMAKGTYDEAGGGHCYWDAQDSRWWTWETPEAIRKKFDSLVPAFGLGGVFAWALREDAPLFAHLKAMT